MNKRILHIAIVLVAIAPLVWLSWLASSPGGVRRVSWKPGNTSSFITSPLPSERVSSIQKSDRGEFVSLIGEPVYIGVFPPSDAFERATVTVEFDPNDAYGFEIGGLTNIAAYAFDFRALSNSRVESLTWPQLAQGEDDTMLVFARNGTRASVEDFLAHQPESGAIVTYKASLPEPYREDSYVPLSRAQTFDVSLRGSHEYVTYIKDEEFSLTITYQDINRTFGADEGYVRIMNEEGVAMISLPLRDDGNTSENQVYSTKTLVLSGDDWPEGVYRVELSGTSDMVWRQFITRQRYMAFKNRLYIADDVGYLPSDRATSFVTNSTSLIFETFHADSAHAVTIGDEKILLPLPHEKTRAVLSSVGVTSGVTEAGDVKMTGEAKFALRRDAFFDPDPRALTPQTNLEDPSLTYLVTEMASVAFTKDGWRTASATFELSQLVKEAGAYKFALSLPGFVVDEEPVDIHSIQVTFYKAPVSLADAAWQELRAWKAAVKERLWLW